VKLCAGQMMIAVILISMPNVVGSRLMPIGLKISVCLLMHADKRCTLKANGSESTVIQIDGMMPSKKQSPRFLSWEFFMLHSEKANEK